MLTRRLHPPALSFARGRCLHTSVLPLAEAHWRTDGHLADGKDAAPRMHARAQVGRQNPRLDAAHLLKSLALTAGAVWPWRLSFITTSAIKLRTYYSNDRRQIKTIPDRLFFLFWYEDLKKFQNFIIRVWSRLPATTIQETKTLCPFKNS